MHQLFRPDIVLYASQAHPRAPRLFAAVLQISDASTSLLPYISEPLQYASSMLAGTIGCLSSMRSFILPARLVQNRRSHVRDAAVFLAVLNEIGAGALFAAKMVSSDVEAGHSSLQTAARLAVDLADTAAAYAVDGDSVCAVLALNTMAVALQTLSVVNASPLAAEDSANSRKALPQFLPTVHALWPAFVSAVVRGSPAAVRRSLEVIPIVASQSGGEFLTERVRADLWPALRRIAAGHNARMRLAAFQCIADLAADQVTVPSLAGVVLEAAELLLAECASVKDDALQPMLLAALDGLAILDQDAVWYLKQRAGLAQLPDLPRGVTGLFAELCR